VPLNAIFAEGRKRVNKVFSGSSIFVANPVKYVHRRKGEIALSLLDLRKNCERKGAFQVWPPAIGNASAKVVGGG
jgi:hypothetical protein